MADSSPAARMSPTSVGVAVLEQALVVRRVLGVPEQLVRPRARVVDLVVGAQRDRDAGDDPRRRPSRLGAAFVMRGTTCSPMARSSAIQRIVPGRAARPRCAASPARARRGGSASGSSVTSSGLCTRNSSFSTSTGPGPGERGVQHLEVVAHRCAGRSYGRPSMSSTIQWCDGPSPSVKRPPHTAWFESACCAIATGWRVWIGMTAVPSSMRSVTWPISATAVRLVQLVAREIIADALLVGGGQRVAWPAGAIDRRHHDFRIRAFLVFHEHHADDFSGHHRSAGQRRTEHQDVERIAVVRDRLRHEAVVHGVAAKIVRHHAIDPSRVGLHVELVLAPFAERNLDVSIHGTVGIHRRRVAPEMLGLRLGGLEALDQLCCRGLREVRGRRAGDLRREGDRQQQENQDVAHASDWSNIRATTQPARQSARATVCGPPSAAGSARQRSVFRTAEFICRLSASVPSNAGGVMLKRSVMVTCAVMVAMATSVGAGPAQS